MLSRIELKGWKTHKDTVLEFAKGTNILIGQMGAGKSSVLDAITYALFGKFPALQHRHIAITDIITNRPAQEQEASVKLYFDVNNRQYEVIRTISLNGSTTAELYADGKYIQSQPQRVNEEISKILQVDYDLFMRAVYAEQNKLTYFLELSPSERKKEIDELLGLDQFSLAQDATTSLINKIKDLAEEAEKSAKSFNIEEIKRKLDEVNKEIGKNVAEKEQKEIEMRELEEKTRAKEEEMNKAKEAWNRKQELSKELEAIKGRAETLEKEIEKISASIKESKDVLNELLKKQEETLKEVEAKQREAKEKESKAIEEASSARAEVAQLEKDEKELDGLEKEVSTSPKEISSVLEKLKQELEKLETRKAALKAEKEESQKILEELSKTYAVCPVCERPLTEELVEQLKKKREEILSKDDAELNEVTKSINAFEAELEKAQQEANRLERNLQRINELKGTREALVKARERQEKAEKEKEESSARAKQIDDEAKAVNNAYNALLVKARDLERKEQYEKELKEANAKAEEIKRALDSIGVTQEQVASIEKEFNELSKKLSALKASVEAMQKLIESETRERDELDEQIKKVEGLYKDVENKRKIAEELVKYKNALIDTQTELRARLVDYINSTMQTIWPELYPYGDYTGIRLEPTDSDYVLKLQTNRLGNEWEAVEAIASGGERSIACLAMRVAFALILVPNLKWLILDEPTHNIDRQGIEKFVRAVSEALPRHIEQIFIITHDELLKQAQNARVYVFSRDKAANKETIVEEA